MAVRCRQLAWNSPSETASDIEPATRVPSSRVPVVVPEMDSTLPSQGRHFLHSWGASETITRSRPLASRRSVWPWMAARPTLVRSDISA